MEQKRNQFLDIIKALCIVFVIITHDTISEETRLKLLFNFWIDMAVPLFMIISGYVYALSFERNGIAQIQQAYTLNFIMPKFIRYTIPFLLAFAIEILGEIAVAFLAIRPFSLKHIVALLFQGGNGPGSYYYPILLQFLLYYPVLYFIIKRYAFKGLILCFAINAGYEFFQRVWGCNETFYRMLLFRYTLVIAFGSYLGQCKGEKLALGWKIASFAAGTAFIIAYRYFAFPPRIIIYWTKTSFLACLYLLPIAAFLICSVHLRFKPLELIGKASFNIFLVQMVYYAYAAGFAAKFFSSHIVHLCFHIGICISAGLIFYAIEQPLTKFALSMWNSRKKLCRVK